MRFVASQTDVNRSERIYFPLHFFRSLQQEKGVLDALGAAINMQCFFKIEIEKREAKWSTKD